MKRRKDSQNPDLPIHIFLRNVEQGLSQEQLVGIGKVAVLWADCDELLNLALYRGLRLPNAVWRGVVSALASNKKMGLINTCARDLLSDDDACKIVAKTVSAVGEVGSLRDDIVHSHIDPFALESGISTNTSRSGARYDVLRTKESLDAVANRLSIVREEITVLIEIFSTVPYSFKQDAKQSRSEGKVHPGSLVAPAIQKLTAHQMRREALPPLPKFPS